MEQVCIVKEDRVLFAGIGLCGSRDDCVFEVLVVDWVVYYQFQVRFLTSIL